MRRLCCRQFRSVWFSLDVNHASQRNINENKRVGKTLPWFVYVITLFLLPGAAAAADKQEVQVIDPYIELRTGPGRGYPVFYIAERGEWVQILRRKTDWYKVKTARGKQGWVGRKQLENTLTKAGVKRTFRDVLLEDYLSRRFEMGIAGGRLENESLIGVRLGYRLTENLLAEFTLAQVTGTFSSKSLYYVNLVSEPFSDKRLSPFLTIGAGRFEDEPKATLISAPKTESTMVNAGVGVRAYVTRRFILRLDYKSHIVLINDNRTDEFKELSVGLSFFF